MCIPISDFLKSSEPFKLFSIYMKKNYPDKQCYVLFKQAFKGMTMPIFIRDLEGDIDNEIGSNVMPGYTEEAADEGLFPFFIIGMPDDAFNDSEEYININAIMNEVTESANNVL